MKSEQQKFEVNKFYIFRNCAHTVFGQMQTLSKLIQEKIIILHNDNINAEFHGQLFFTV